MKQFWLLFLFSTCYMQNEVLIFSTKSDVLISRIEKNIIKHTFDLYNKSHKVKLLPKIVEFKNFSLMMEKFNSQLKPKTHSMLVINRITITDTRKKSYDFSRMYIPGKLVYVEKKGGSETIEIDRKKSLLYVKGTTHETVAKKISMKFSMPISPAESSINFYNDLENGLFSYGLIENISIWNKNHFRIIKDTEFQEGQGYGIMYPKGSQLRNKLDKYLHYYLKSTGFKTLLKKSYNQEVLDYFIKAMLKK